MNNFNFTGTWTIKSTNLRTGVVTTKVVKNAITQGFFTAIHRFLSQDQLIVANDELNITHVALGEGLTGAVRADAHLEDEYFRTTIASKAFTDLVHTVNIYLDGFEGNPVGGYIKELGIFSNAINIKDNGTLISRANIDEKKNENISLNLKWELRGN